MSLVDFNVIAATTWQNRAAELLLAVKTGERDLGRMVRELADAPAGELKNELNTDAKKKAFWCNIYNAYSQIYLRMPKHSRLSAVQSLFFFEKKLFTIAGRKLSLNDVEHGILRRSRIWWSRGYLKKWFPTRYEKNFRADRLDPRIHFALNCGAVSCPPIRFYTAEDIDREFDLATQNYLEPLVRQNEGLLELPQLIWAYLADFGGKKGVIKMLNEQLELKLDVERPPRFKYIPFDRSEQLHNFG